MDYLSYNGPDNGNKGSGTFSFFLIMMLMFAAMTFFMPTPEQTQEQLDKQNLEKAEKEAAKTIPAVIKYPMTTRTIETPQITVTMTNAGGGRAQSVMITDPERYTKHGDFIRSQKSDNPNIGGILPISMTLPSFGITSETQFEAVSDQDDHSTAAFAYTDDSLQHRIIKTFTATDKPYVIHAKFELINDTSAPIEDTLTMSMFIKQIEGEEPGLFTPGSYVAAKCYADGDMEYVDATDNNEHETYTEDVKWFAVDESYFAVAAAVDGAKSCEIRNDEGLLSSNLAIPVTVAAGAVQTVEFDIYMGPKESKYLDILGDENNLPAIIDYGWIEILAKPMAFILDVFHNWTGNWGLAIIILTLIVRGLLWPIAQKSQVSMMRMSKVAPLVQELQEKYKDDPATLQQKQIELYQTHQINPFGCLPLLLQMPIFFALYRCIFVTGGLYNASFVLWIQDLSAPDPYFVLPLLSVALLVGQQLMTPSTVQSTQQKVMMYSMPVIFGLMMLFLPSGLCLYMVVSSGFSIIQSTYVRHIFAKEDREKNNNIDGVEVLSPENMSSKDKRAAKRRGE